MNADSKLVSNRAISRGLSQVGYTFFLSYFAIADLVVHWEVGIITVKCKSLKRSSNQKPRRKWDCTRSARLSFSFTADRGD